MNKKLLIWVIVVLLIAMGIVTYLLLTPEKTPKVYHVGILSGLDLFSGIVDSFKKEMMNIGYIEGKNIVYDLQKTNFEPDKERQILNKFVA